MIDTHNWSSWCDINQHAHTGKSHKVMIEWIHTYIFFKCLLWFTLADKSGIYFWFACLIHNIYQIQFIISNLLSVILLRKLCVFYVYCYFFPCNVYRKSIFIADSDTRKLLKKFSKSSKKHPYLSDDFVSLIDGCSKHQASLVSFLNQLNEKGQTSACLKVYQPLLQALSSTSPVCGLVCPDDDLLELIHMMAIGVSPKKDLNAMQLLSNKVRFM